ncbi:hypothetical protein [Streptomyces chartreusis]|uniref:hypothetical protein n=1 Tax=Streptomyces chartreusis TaxID=1969 RepID=UPI0033A8B910
MQTRTVALIAGSAAAVAMTITGVTYASADAPRSGPASAPLGGDHDWKDDDDKRDYKDDHDKNDRGQIQINERTYTADPGGCVSLVNIGVAAPLDATSFNIRNDSDRTVEFFNGVTCDNGAPVATVGPRSSSNAVTTTAEATGLNLGSFRVVG